MDKARHRFDDGRHRHRDKKKRSRRLSSSSSDSSRERYKKKKEKTDRGDQSDERRRSKDDKLRQSSSKRSEPSPKHEKPRQDYGLQAPRVHDGDPSRRSRPQEAKVSVSGPPAQPEKQKPTFALSGKLAEDTNTFNGVVIKYNQPPEAKTPKRKWRLYPFKGDESLPFIPIHNQSAFLLGRDRKVADIPIDHPSCSSQHAVIQFRAVTFERDDGSKGKRTRPYIIDLESSNGTFLNSKRLEPRKYYEIFEKDVLKFGFSSRDYVVMHEDYSEDDEIL